MRIKLIIRREDLIIDLIYEEFNLSYKYSEILTRFQVVIEIIDLLVRVIILSLIILEFLFSLLLL